MRQALIGRPESQGDVGEYLKGAEVAETLGVSRNTAEACADSERLPAHRNPANGYRLPRSADPERFLQQIATTQTRSEKR